jgi:hypothetical protein
MPAETIDDVIRSLDAIIDWAWTNKSRLGYFAALYRRITRAVKTGIEKGQFQNGPLMERLDVVFANRYLEAFEQFRSGGQPSQSWQTAFRAASRWYPIVVQHLLAGVNAHINLDLGIAAAATAPGDQLPSLKTNFLQINNVLAGEVGTVEKEIAEVSPLIGLLEKFSLKTDSVIINFSLEKARDFAWSQAVNLAPKSGPELQAAIRSLDAEVDLLAHLIVSPPLLIRLELFPIRALESNRVRLVLDVLARTKPEAAVVATAS